MSEDTVDEREMADWFPRTKRDGPKYVTNDVRHR